MLTVVCPQAEGAKSYRYFLLVKGGWASRGDCLMSSRGGVRQGPGIWAGKDRKADAALRLEGVKMERRFIAAAPGQEGDRLCVWPGLRLQKGPLRRVSPRSVGGIPISNAGALLWPETFFWTNGRCSFLLRASREGSTESGAR